MTDQRLSHPDAAEQPVSSDETSKVAEKPVFIITGLSGAGKSTVLHVFEDMRLLTADGVPPGLMPEMVRLLQNPSVERSSGVALGFDQRRSEFMEELDQALHRLASMGLRTQIIYLEADPVVIMRRYATTRRPHPLEREGVGLEQAIREEMERLPRPGNRRQGHRHVGLLHPRSAAGYSAPLEQHAGTSAEHQGQPHFLRVQIRGSPRGGYRL